MSDNTTTEEEVVIPTISLEEKTAYRRRLFKVNSHISNVNAAAELLADRIIDTADSKEDMDFARRLLQSVKSHDLSKFTGIEWEALHPETEPELRKIAIHQHQQTNSHHPEYHVGGISQMSDLEIAEMVCDWKSRSSEFATDLRTYIKDVATARWGFSTRHGVYRKIKKYVDLLLDDPF